MANPPVNDGTLTAYLDGELTADEEAALERRLAADVDLRDRLEVLRSGSRPFRPAYAVLLEAAPAERLGAMLADLADKNAGVRRRSVAWRQRLATIAAALVIFAAGAVAGYFLPSKQAEPPGWRQVVAEYYRLVAPETLLAIRADVSAISEELAVIGDRLALDLSPERIALPDGVLKRAQLYQFEGRPLVQLAYLSPVGPVALCIITTRNPDVAPQFEQRVGSNIVFWNKGGQAYMLISKTASREVLETYVRQIASRLR